MHSRVPSDNFKVSDVKACVGKCSQKFVFLLWYNMIEHYFTVFVNLGLSKEFEKDLWDGAHLSNVNLSEIEFDNFRFTKTVT